MEYYIIRYKTEGMLEEAFATKDKQKALTFAADLMSGGNSRVLSITLLNYLYRGLPEASACEIETVNGAFSLKTLPTETKK